MRVFNYSVLITALLTLIVSQTHAKEYIGESSKANNVKAKAAGCSPAQSWSEFYVNNVRTAAETGGNTWYDRGNSLPYYEVPAGEGNHAIFAGSLWLGGVDPAGNLKLAAVRFRQLGNDYWPGPLSVDGSASIDAATCTEWDRFFNMSKQMVETHRYYFTLLHMGIDPATDPLFESGYTIPQEILEWPAHGNPALGQSNFIAPFADLRDPDTQEVLTTPGLYEPELGDYPLYDLEQEIDCRTRLVTDPVPLFGDYTMYWIFNDKGNVHTESQGEPIGMEIQAQMFAFTTNDEINNMTFVNYVLINRGTLTLQNTYFAQWVDTDLGYAFDDYIGCDVERGLGYSYNGNEVDQGGTVGPGGYGAQPPAIGVDFFEGPYQDADGINNHYGIGPNEALNGLGYLNPADTVLTHGPDSIIDNERFGMRRFLFHNNTQGPMGDPNIAIHYYRMMQGFWKGGEPMIFGGTGYDPNCTTCLKADFMFPGDSDPLNWGTQGVDPNYPHAGGWTEENENNPPDDRRFVQSAGPFTLEPGQFNNITVGIVYARAQTGGAFASVRALLQADDKAQALFENCFRLLDGPNAPDLTAQELDKEIILYLRNTSSLSNNRNEEYLELDPTIPPTKLDSAQTPNDQYYRFQGYKIYQLKDASVSVSDIEDERLARLVFQADIKDFKDNDEPIGQIINYEFDQQVNLPVPVEKVNGANEGIRHSVRITTDRFAQGDTRLVNFKKYYFVAIAYGYNNYEEYNPDPNKLSGQPRPYLRGRAGAVGDIQSITVIPHKPIPEKDGTVFTTQYGDGVQISRLEGRGNGGNDLVLTTESVDRIMKDSPYRADVLTYEPGKGPIDVKVVDPLNVKPAKFTLRFYNDKDENGIYEGDIDDARWYMIDENNPADTIFSERSIRVANEQIIPEYGISVTIGQYNLEIVSKKAETFYYYPEILGNSIEFANEEEAWLTGVSDQEGNSFFNWIRSGVIKEDDVPGTSTPPCFLLENGAIAPFVFNDHDKVDDQQLFENVIDGTWAPARLVAAYDCGPTPLTTAARAGIIEDSDDLSTLESVDIFFTKDKSRWSRVPVFELQPQSDFAQLKKNKLRLRGALSVDKNGRNQLHPDANIDECTHNGTQVLRQQDLDEMGAAGLSEFLTLVNEEYPSITTADQLIGLSFGMGWFPGYAISPESGERLNLAFGENSYLAGDNGSDMMWNPSSRVLTQSGTDYIFGGEHYIYTFRNRRYEYELAGRAPEMALAFYDGGQNAYEMMRRPTGPDLRRFYRNFGWIGFPMLASGHSWDTPENGLVPGEAKISLHVASPYEPYATLKDALGDASYPTPLPNTNYEHSTNFWYPAYEFTTEGVETHTNVLAAAQEALDLIDIVPNPYYAYSAYEQGRVDNRVKFVNLPPKCKISIFTLNGTLINVLEKDNPSTFLEWNLQNEFFIPISGGMYLIHVEAQGIGSRTLKFFAATRPTDLRNF